MGRQTNGPQDQQVTRPIGHQTNGPLDQWATRPMGHQTNGGPLDQEATRPMSHYCPCNGALDQWVLSVFLFCGLRPFYFVYTDFPLGVLYPKHSQLAVDYVVIACSLESIRPGIVQGCKAPNVVSQACLITASESGLPHAQTFGGRLPTQRHANILRAQWGH